MLDRRLRIAFVALAVWSVLFAPAMGDGDVRAPAEVRAQRLAAAVVAPTIETAALVASPTCRRDVGDLDRCDLEPPGHELVSASIDEPEGGWVLPNRSPGCASHPGCRSSSQRGPPLS